MNTNQTILLIVGIAAVGGIAYFVIKGRQNQIQDPPPPSGNSSGNGTRNNVIDQYGDLLNSGVNQLDRLGESLGF